MIIYMSNLNNIYGLSNSCPPIMDDGRGVNTIYKNSQVLNTELKNTIKSNNSLQYRMALQSQGVDLVNNTFNKTTTEFMCDKDPQGWVKMPTKQINLTTTGGNWKNQFQFQSFL